MHEAVNAEQVTVKRDFPKPGYKTLILTSFIIEATSSVLPVLVLKKRPT